MEKLVKHKHVKSIGVSNFTIPDLQILLSTCHIRPVVNQILMHPYVMAKQTPLLEYMESHQIIPEAYSALIPLTSKPGGPVDEPVQKIGERLGAKPEQVSVIWEDVVEMGREKSRRQEDHGRADDGFDAQVLLAYVRAKG